MGDFKVYTKTGDKGTTGLIGGTRVPKHHLRLEAYGTVDELNAFTGLIRSCDIPKDLSETLYIIQNKLFVIGAYLATDKNKIAENKIKTVSEEDILFLEHKMDEMDKNLPALTAFVLPGGSILNGYCHTARTVCRRAERCANRLASELEISNLTLKYLNRLSDYFFVLSRKVLVDNNIDEIKWNAEL